MMNDSDRGGKRSWSGEGTIGEEQENWTVGIRPRGQSVSPDLSLMHQLNAEDYYLVELSGSKCGGRG